MYTLLYAHTPLPYNGQILLHLPRDQAPWEGAGLFLTYTVNVGLNQRERS